MSLESFSRIFQKLTEFEPRFDTMEVWKAKGSDCKMTNKIFNLSPQLFSNWKMFIKSKS